MRDETEETDEPGDAGGGGAPARRSSAIQPARKSPPSAADGAANGSESEALFGPRPERAAPGDRLRVYELALVLSVAFGGACFYARFRRILPVILAHLLWDLVATANML